MKGYFEAFLLIIAIIILIYLFFYFAQTINFPTITQSATGSVCFDKNCFSVEVATTKAQLEKGLMYRGNLEKDRGMLFIFENESRQSFWMKNTLISLDIIWINGDGNVVFISKNTQPCQPASLREALLTGSSLICPSVSPLDKAKYVLEINGGMCDQIGLKVGDKLELNI